MADGMYLPQSAVPLGQTPLQIQAPRTQVSIPGPLDVTNFYRMQQGIRQDISLIQQNQMMDLRRKELEQRIHENKMREVESMIQMTNGMFKDQYAQYTDSKKQQGAANPLGGSLMEGLNSVFAGHDKVIRENQALQEAAQGELDVLVKDYLSSNSNDPSVRYETVRRMRNVIQDYKNQMMRNAPFREYTSQQRNFDNWLAGIEAAQAEGKDVDMDAVQERINEYQQFANGDTRIKFRLGDWNINDFAFNGAGKMTELTTYIDELAAKKTDLGFEEIDVPGGGFLTGDATGWLTEEQIIDAAHRQFDSDREFNQVFNNSQKKIPHVDEDGNPIEYTKRDFIADIVRGRVPAGRKAKTVQAKGQTVINQPKKASTDPTYPYQDLSAGKPGNEGFEENHKYIDQKFIRAGVNPYGLREDGTPVTADDIEDMRTNNSPYRKFRFVDGNGTPVPPGDPNAIAYEYYEEGYTADNGTVVAETVKGTFPLLKDKPIAGGETPKLSLQQVPDNLVPITEETIEAQGLDRFEWKEDVNAVHPETLAVIQDIPNDFDGIAFTETFRTDEMNAALEDSDPNSIHKMGKGLDVRMNDQGTEFYEWGKTEEGKAWLDKHNYAIEEHGDHYHMYQRQGDERVPVSNKQGVDVHRVKSMSPEQVYDERAKEVKTTLAGNDKSLDIADKLLMGLTTEGDRITVDDIDYILANPPQGNDRMTKAMRTAISGAREQWDKQNALQARRDVLEDQREMLIDMGTPEDSPKIAELDGALLDVGNKMKTFEEATSVEAFGELLRLELMEEFADENKEQIIKDFADPTVVTVDGKESHVSTLRPGGEQYLEYTKKQTGSTGLKKNQQNGSYVIRSKSGSNYIVIPMYGQEDETFIRNNISEDNVWERRKVYTPEEFGEYMQKVKGRLTDKTVDRIANYVKMSTDYQNAAKERYFSRVGLNQKPDSTEKRVEEAKSSGKYDFING